MARPQKFRHQREDLADPKIAEKLGHLVIEIENLRLQKSKIDEQLAAAFDAVDDAGFEKKYVRKVVALRAKEDGVRREEEDGLESYEFAIEKGVSLAHARRKPANDQFDPLTGEFIDDDEITRPATLAVSGGEPSIPSSDAGGEKMDGGCTPPGRSDEQSGHICAQSGQATNINSEMDRATEGSFETGSEAAEKGRKATATVAAPADLNHAGAGESPAAEKATVATQGEATEPTSDDGEATGTYAGEDRAAANAGGDDVDGGAERAEQDPTSKTGEGAASALPAKSGMIIESVPPAPMKRPDFASCFPELSNAAYAHLHDEIQASGICAPIIRSGEVIVDGWDRYNISRELGFNYPVQPYTGTDVLLDVIDLQRASRNFTPAQEKKIAADLAKEFPRRADEIIAAFGLAEALEAAE